MQRSNFQTMNTICILLQAAMALLACRSTQEKMSAIYRRDVIRHVVSYRYPRAQCKSYGENKTCRTITRSWIGLVALLASLALVRWVVLRMRRPF